MFQFLTNLFSEYHISRKISSLVPKSIESLIYRIVTMLTPLQKWNICSCSRKYFALQNVIRNTIPIIRSFTTHLNHLPSSRRCKAHLELTQAYDKCVFSDYLVHASYKYLRCCWCTWRFVCDPFTSNVWFATVWCTQPLGTLCAQEVKCTTSARQGLNFKSCLWQYQSRHPQEVLLVPWSAKIVFFIYINQDTNAFFQFEIIINNSCSFRFISIPMVWEMKWIRL